MQSTRLSHGEAALIFLHSDDHDPRVAKPVWGVERTDGVVVSDSRGRVGNALSFTGGATLWNPLPVMQPASSSGATTE